MVVTLCTRLSWRASPQGTMTAHIETQRGKFGPVLREIARATDIDVMNDVSHLTAILAATAITNPTLYGLVGGAFLGTLAIHWEAPQHEHLLKVPIIMAGEWRYFLERIRDNFLRLERENPALAKRYGREVLARLHPESMELVGIE